MSPTEVAAAAAQAALANLPTTDPLTAAAPGRDGLPADFDGVAVSARFSGTCSGEVLVAVERAVSDALQNSPLGSLDIGAALAPALEAAAKTVGNVIVGPGQALDPGPALDALLAKPTGQVVVLSHEGAPRALVGIALVVDETPAEALTTPQYPTPDELRATQAANATPATGARGLSGLDMLRDVSMEVTAQIGTTRMTINELLSLSEGAVVELDRAAGAPADLLVNGHLIARGEVVVIDENFALRITEIVDETSSNRS